MSTENTITTAAADVAAAPNATLDELVGTTTNTAILPEPDAHAYDEIATGDADPLILGGHKFTSRFILGSGRYDLNLIKATIENAGTQIVTMALRRCRTTENNLLDYIPKGITMLPNTSVRRTQRGGGGAHRTSRARGVPDGLREGGDRARVEVPAA